ncbi:F-box domain-containing protein [Meloidogyne graminicola]|uniref:F-box domain-containing protein n=1 Tax=Meloidogyne graminicola TaxID=189291 RepID=A0A8S9ZVL3_9BILA|nr:F-box domain-containing protein [Meloidogyne graminicola]
MGFFPELPAFIWEDILEFLSFRKKILIEKKSLLLKNLCLKYGYNYKEVRFFPTFLDEDRYIAGLDDISKMRAFRAFFTRCSKLTFLYIKEDIINSFIGRFFYLLKNITHLSIQQPVGMVYLNVIEEHLAHSLISLGLVLNNQEETIPSCIHLLVNLIKLESLKINKFDSLYQKSINMELQQFLPSTIKNLFISEYTRESLFAVKENCPEISSLLFIELANFRVVLNEQILSHCTPIFFASLFLQFNFHPNKSLVKALRIECAITSQYELTLISTRFPNLVHLDFYWPSYRSDPIILTKLLNFNHLSSFSIKMFIYDLNVEEAILFHEYTFEGRRFDAFFLDILIELNTKNRLRNLEFNYSADFYLNKEYVILIFSHLKVNFV